MDASVDELTTEQRRALQMVCDGMRIEIVWHPHGEKWACRIGGGVTEGSELDAALWADEMLRIALTIGIKEVGDAANRLGIMLSSRLAKMLTDEAARGPKAAATDAAPNAPPTPNAAGSTARH